MAREKHSTIERRRHGCLGGCLIRLLVLLGLAAFIFVAGCMTGIISNDSVTGKPTLTLGNIHAPEMGDLTGELGRALESITGFFGGIKNIKWPFGISANGLTVKALHAGDGESFLICADGFTMIADAGSGTGNLISAEMLLSGVNQLTAAAALSSDDTNVGGMSTLLSRYKPQYFFYQNTQTKSKSYDKMLEAANRAGSESIVAQSGLSFTLGRGRVSVIGPVSTNHSVSADDGLSLRIDYRNTRILILGTILQSGGRELVRWQREAMPADVLILGSGGSAVSSELLDLVHPRYVIVAGKQDDAAVSRIRTTGYQTFSVKENGTIQVYTDGTTLRVDK